MAAIAVTRCLRAIKDWAEISVQSPETTYTDSHDTFRAVTDADRRGRIESKLNANPFGKAVTDGITDHTVVVKYYAQVCDEGSDTPTTDICALDPDSFTGTPLTTPVLVDQFREYSFKLSYTNYLENCESIARDRITKLRAAKQYFLREIGAFYRTTLAAAAGNYFSDSLAGVVDSKIAPKDVLLYIDDSVNAKPNAEALFPVQYQYERMGMGVPVMIGQGLFRRYLKSASMGTYSNNPDGYNAVVDGVIPYVDYKLAQTAGLDSQSMITFAVDTIHRTFYNFYESGEFARTEDGRISKTTFDLAPEFSFVKNGTLIMGLPVDWIVMVDDCNLPYGEEKHLLQARFGAWTVPDDAFNADCGQYHNGILLWQDACGVKDCPGIRDEFGDGTAT